MSDCWKLILCILDFSVRVSADGILLAETSSNFDLLVIAVEGISYIVAKKAIQLRGEEETCYGGRTIPDNGTENVGETMHLIFLKF